MSLTRIVVLTTMESFALFSESAKKTGNVNIAVILTMLTCFPSKTISVFGGALRDMIRGKPSNDVDIVCQQEVDNYRYDQTTGVMSDTFFDKLLAVFSPIGALTQSAKAVINYKYDSKEEVDDNSDSFVPDERVFDMGSTTFPFTVDHIKYNLTLLVGSISHNFILDVSFVKNMAEFTGFSPSCYQDSLYIDTQLSSSALSSVDDVTICLEQSLQTYCSPTKTVREITEDIRAGLIEICDVTTFKRYCKILRFVREEGYKLKDVGEEIFLKHSESIEKAIEAERVNVNTISDRRVRHEKLMLLAESRLPDGGLATYI